MNPIGGTVLKKEDDTPNQDPKPKWWEKPWLSKRELSLYLGFSTRFIDAHLRPFLSVYKPNPGFGTKILFSRAEVDRLIESRKEISPTIETL